jgi:hypothetical protein
MTFARRRIARMAGIIAILGMPALLPQVAGAQTQVPFNQRDDQYRLLGLKRAREAYEVARSEYERQQDLFNRRLITQAELERARSVFTDAEVNYQQSLLAVLFEQQYVSVLEAVKIQGADGTKHVRIKVANMSGGTAEFQELVGVEDDLFRSLKPDIVHNVYVSILNDDGAIISQPYEAKIDTLRYGHPRTLDFTLLQDLEAVTVYLIYGNGTERNFKVFLQKDTRVDKVVIQSEQFSQEVPLGQTAGYDLSLELFSGKSDTYSLEVLNLPDQIARYFSDPSGKVRLSQLRFTESARTKPASLQVTLPDRPSDDVAMDVPISFYALVVPRSLRPRFDSLAHRTVTEDQVRALDVGYVRLELLPRGKGELRVRVPMLFHSIRADEQVHMTVDLYNEGSHRVDNVNFDVDLPLEWRKEISPANIPALGIGEDAQVDLTFIPPAGVPEGRYDIRLRTQGSSDSQPITGEDKTITVEVRGGTGIVSTGLILVLLVGLVGAAVVWAVRLSKR